MRSERDNASCLDNRSTVSEMSLELESGQYITVEIATSTSLVTIAPFFLLLMVDITHHHISCPAMFQTWC